MESSRPEVNNSKSNELAQPLDYAEPETRTRGDALATASVACGLLFLPGVLLLATVDGGTLLAFMVVSLPFAAVVLGLVARRREKRRGVSGRSMARAYLILGGIEVVLMLIVGMVMPQLGRSRETAKRVICGSNLRQIGQAVQSYALDHGGYFPTDLESLLLSDDVTASVLICPSTTEVAAKAPTTQALVRQLRSETGHCSYIYVGAGLTNDTVTPVHVLAYEPMSNHGGDGMNVLYGDLHVDFIGRSEAASMLNELQRGHNPPRAEGAMTSVTIPATSPK